MDETGTHSDEPRADALRAAPSRFDDDDLGRLRIALARISRRMFRLAAEGGLTRSQASLLATLARRGTLGVRDLADIEGLNPTMCSRMLGKLEERGLVARSPDADDKRVVRAHITDAGAALAEELRVARTALFAEHLAGLDAAHAEALHAALPALEALADSMGCRGAGGCP